MKSLTLSGMLLTAGLLVSAGCSKNPPPPPPGPSPTAVPRFPSGDPTMSHGGTNTETRPGGSSPAATPPR
ncbi:MAG TPA: hypothetical protein VF595_07800 [Tepidisphaeraceae bacterium]|jgi:hypothetical protein